MCNRCDPNKPPTHYPATPPTEFERRVFASHKKRLKGAYRAQMLQHRYDDAVVTAANFLLTFGEEVK